MRHHRFVTLGLLLTLLLSVRLLGGEAKYLVGTYAFDPIALLPVPPAAGTAEDLADRDSAYAVYHARSAEDVALGKEENRLNIFHFSPAIGPWFQPNKFPKLEALFAQIENDTKLVTNAAKDHWKRIRPYKIDPARFTDPIENEKDASFSYPSGHSTRGTVYSLVLADLFPEKQAAILAEGRQMGWLRVEGGVHHPIDIYAGRVLGQAIVRGLMANPAFVQSLNEVRAEIKAASVK